MNKPIIGISQGDPNGVGLEVIIKAFGQPMLFDHCIPVLYASTRSFQQYKKLLNAEHPVYVQVKDISEVKGNQLNLIAVQSDLAEVNPGVASVEAGKEALAAINRMLEDAVAGKLHAIVTAPVDKSTIKAEPEFTGHTSYISNALGAESSLMVLFNDDIKIGLLTEHLPLSQVSAAVSKELIIKKLKIANECLKRDFGILKPKIAVLGLNPHNGDNGIMGREELETIIPAVEVAKSMGIFCFGPYSADGFFGMKAYCKFDMVLAMYHDQGLIPFKSMAFEDGVNYTAGLPVLRSSPDHGTAYDIAGKNVASPLSFVNAVFAAIDIYHQRQQTDHLRENPLKYSELRRERFRLEQA